MSAQPAKPATQLTSGVTLNAVESIADRQQIYNREQVAYLVALAYETGRIHAATEDMAEVVACWTEFAEPRATREQRIAIRLAEMDAGTQREQRRPANQWLRQVYADMDWPEVAMPGTVDLAMLTAVWPSVHHGNPDKQQVDNHRRAATGTRRHLRVVA